MHPVVYYTEQEVLNLQTELEHWQRVAKQRKRKNRHLASEAQLEIGKLQEENRKLKEANLTAPLEHSFAEHEAYENAKRKLTVLEDDLRDAAHEHEELQRAVADVIDFPFSATACDIDVLEEFKTLKHKYDNTTEVLAATTRQRDQLQTRLANYGNDHEDISRLREEERELRLMVARAVGYEAPESIADDINILQEFIDLKHKYSNATSLLRAVALQRDGQIEEIKALREATKDADETKC